MGSWIISFGQECYMKVLSSSWHFVMLFDSYFQPKLKFSKEDVLCTVFIILCCKNEKNIYLHKLKYIKRLHTVTVLIVYQLLYMYLTVFAKTCLQLTLKTVPVARSVLTTPLARRKPPMQARDRDLSSRGPCQHRTFKQAQTTQQTRSITKLFGTQIDKSNWGEGVRARNPPLPLLLTAGPLQATSRYPMHWAIHLNQAWRRKTKPKYRRIVEWCAMKRNKENDYFNLHALVVVCYVAQLIRARACEGDSDKDVGSNPDFFPWFFFFAFFFFTLLFIIFLLTGKTYL